MGAAVRERAPNLREEGKGRSLNRIPQACRGPKMTAGPPYIHTGQRWTLCGVVTRGREPMTMSLHITC